ncbi:hypothetical protein J3U99_22505 [Brucella pituitosa]|uniref:hypothetical protein n=1 Tax=Brucella pituitosa TaxID=571256 RepID=UPI0020058F32|nr:hypothetical protein [Brucella pituitosa]MCK4207533.1 hypothetical protein [Brucella pituitosa]
MKSITTANKDEELQSLAKALAADITSLNDAAKDAAASHWDKAARDNEAMKSSSVGLEPVAEKAKVLVKSLDHLYKLAVRFHEADVAAGTKPTEGKKRLNEFDAARHEVAEHLKGARYFLAQAQWLQEHFPKAQLRDVEGLVKLVDHTELKTHDWSLTPGRYVGVSPEVEDEEFDFEAALRDIHLEIEGLNAEAVTLAATIKKNMEDLIV